MSHVLPDEGTRRSYALLTTVRDEEDTLGGLFLTVASQTLLPDVWVVVDDGSIDQTSVLLRQLSEQQSFRVIAVRKEESSGAYWLGYGAALRFGWEVLAPIIREHVNAVGILDADIRLPIDYFERLYRSLEDDPRLAAISGELCNEHFSRDTRPGRRPRGGLRLMRASYLKRVGGVPATPSPDTVMDIVFEERGYSVTRDNSICAETLRPSMQFRGVFHGAALFGAGRYRLGLSPLGAILTSLALGIQRRHFGALFGFIYGYSATCLRGEQRLGPTEVQRHFRRVPARALEKLLGGLRRFVYWSNQESATEENEG